MTMRRMDDEVIKDEVLAALREEGSTLLPPEGGWVTVYGLGIRGKRVPRVLHDAGIQHLDIYWGFNEQCPWKTLRYMLEQTKDTGDLAEYICETSRIGREQVTLIDLNTPNPATIRAWQGELRWFKQETIEMMLAEGFLVTLPLSKELSHPIWDEATRDIIGSLMVDGLSYGEAQQELLRAGEKFEVDHKLPNYFYRAAGLYREQFCEEDD